MFSQLAPGYDRMNRIMTFGMDTGWRERVVHAVAPPAHGRALDVGTGTGDFLPLLAAWMPHGVAVGVDFTVPMMQSGLPKLAAADSTSGSRNNTERADVVSPEGADLPTSGKMAFVGGDALQLPFPDNSFDALTTGFVLRNVADIPAALAEMWRVVRPGGVMACLEVARPRNPLLRWGHWLYFQQLVPNIAALFGGNRRFYTYLPQSARNFPTPPALAEMMRAAGWHYVTYSLHSMGAVAIHVGGKV
ncbi:MAG: class I SAM-dependent methyltransferase [Chloroflexaceae bacterium]|nr:class I SAM-dependent methyltransferase [Chloroflexaceae bacterium]